MDVTIVGGHGQIALLLAHRLSAAGHVVRSTYRKAEHEDDVHASGATPVKVDLEADESGLPGAIKGADAVVFAAGAGPGSGDERKRTVDLGGATKLIDACLAEGVKRYVIVSAIGLDRTGEEGDMGAYLQAKLEADEALMGSGLDWTVVRPGHLTDDAATGQVQVAEHLEPGEVPRDDVAWVLHAVLEQDSTVGKVFELVGGDTPISEAVAQL